MWKYKFFEFCAQKWTIAFYLGIAGLAPLASYFFSAAKKSNHYNYAPKKQGFPLKQYSHHAVKRRSCASCARDICASMHVNSPAYKNTRAQTVFT